MQNRNVSPDPFIAHYYQEKTKANQVRVSPSLSKSFMEPALDQREIMKD